jgi:HK97 family phage major capsid protein
MTTLQEIHDLVIEANTAISAKHSAFEKRLDEIETKANRPGSTFSAASGPAPDVKEHLDAFTAFLRAPRDVEAKAALAAIERKAASGATDPAGGFLIPEIILGPLLRRVTSGNPLREIVRQVQVATRDVNFPLSNGNGVTGWIGENATRTDTAEPTLTNVKPTFGTVYALVTASEELVMDSAFNIAGWFVAEAGDRMAEAEATAIVTGNGTDKPTGLLNTAPQAGADGARTNNAFRYLPTGTAATLGVNPLDVLMGAVYDLKAGHRANARWVMNSATAGALRVLKDSTGRFLWADSAAAGQPATLAGYPVVICEAMPNVGANAHPIAFGNLDRGYILADNGALRVTVDDNITAPGKVRWYIRKRVGGIPFDNEAVRFIKCATT